MGFNPEQLKNYRKKLRAMGICTRCHKPLIDGASTGKLCVNCLEQTLNNKRLWREFKRMNGERYT